MSHSDLASLLVATSDLCLVGAFVGCVFTLLASFFVLRYSGQETRGGDAPPVSILKPLHGTEPDLAARLTRFCQQDYTGPVQLVMGTQDDAAPATAVARQIKAAFPGKTIEIAVDERRHGSNRKVSNLINMQALARYETVVVSDSDIVVGSDYLGGIAGLLSRPNVGAVTCLYHGSGDGLWAQLAAMAINTQFLPQAIVAGKLGLEQHCCGATIAMRRSTLDRIGGFAAFADTLADDYAIGAAVRSFGYDVVTAPFLVGHRCFEANWRQLVRHQLRVARTIRSIEPLGYAGTIVTHPLPLALLGMLSGGATATLVVAASLSARVLLCRCVEGRFGLARQKLWLVPVYDIIAFAVYVASFFGTTVHWRGADYRVMADGSLVERNT